MTPVGSTLPPGRFEHVVLSVGSDRYPAIIGSPNQVVLMSGGLHKNVARSDGAFPDGGSSVGPHGKWSSVSSTVGYNASALICAVLVGAMFACRMKMLFCAKKAGVKRPPLDLLVMSFLAFLIIIASNVIGNASSLANGLACTAAAYLSPIVHIIIKQLIYVHLIQRVHTIRGCHECSHPSTWQYRQKHRCKSDRVWLFLMIFTFISSTALMVDVSLSVRHVYSIGDLACLVGLNKRGRIHLVAATLAANLALILSFLWIVACTVTHYPDLRTVPTWQHWIRTAFSKLIPGFVKDVADRNGVSCGDEQAEPGVGVNCPAYLVCLNENTAGKAEQAAWTAVLASVVLLIPTVVNLSLLMEFDGLVGAWPFLNSLWIEVSVQLFVLHFFSKDPFDRDAVIQVAQWRAVEAERATPMASPHSRLDYLSSPTSGNRGDGQGAHRSPYPNLEASMESLTVSEGGHRNSFIEPPTTGGASKVSAELRPESQATTAVQSDLDRATERRAIGHSSMSTVGHGESVGESSKASESKDDQALGNESMSINAKDFADAA